MKKKMTMIAEIKGRMLRKGCEDCGNWHCCEGRVYDACIYSIPSDFMALRNCAAELAMRKLAGADPVELPSTVPGMIVKCPHCREKSFAPIENFDGNIGEVRGKCNKCMKEIYILMVVCRGEEVENIMKDTKNE